MAADALRYNPSQTYTITQDEQFVDYCLWPYEPSASPINKFHSINLLLHSFDTTSADPNFYRLCENLQTHMGRGKTVWGIKNVDNQLSWELYFYDYRRLQRSRSIELALRSLKPYVHSPLRAPAHCPYFMFSIELNSALLSGNQALDEISIYVGNTGCDVSSGLCYELTTAGLAFKNLYYFYDAQTQMDDIKGKIACSAHLDLERFKWEMVLWPEMLSCKTIVVANKRYNDAIYFSRITVKQLLSFLRRLNYPSDIIAFIDEHREQLDHLLFDVGIDYRMENGTFTILKSGYYGYF